MEQRLLVLSSFSALQFWLSSHGCLADKFSLEKRKMTKLPSPYRMIYKQEDISIIAEEYRLSLPLHVIADSLETRLHNPSLQVRVRPTAVPEQSYLKINDALYICCPELCFLQVASECSEVKLTEIANNLCARYVINKDAEYLQERRDCITNTSSIKKYLGSVGKVRGIEKAKNAIRYALDGSNSPIESKLAVLCMLPFYKGGFAEGGLVLNDEVKLSAAAAALLGRSSCCCDGVWKKDRVIMEYDSNLVHLSPEKHAYDKRRATALTLSGYKVITVTANDIRNHQAIENLFRNIRIAR